jgi:protein-glutamine gamma-glutamyltransferase
MIIVNQKALGTNEYHHWISSREKLNIIEMMGQYSQVYEYQTIDQLDFELEMRVQIMKAAVLLDKSGAEFTGLRYSKCNEKYWRRTPNGAFILKANVPPQTGIADIFRNGKKYAFECATAIVIIFYKAVLESVDKNVFNQLFSGLYLYDWQHDQDLDLPVHDGRDFLPGDCVYFKNPEYNPKTPQWRGENSIVMGKNLYFGHGIGMRTSQFIINYLNKKRQKNSHQPAYLTTEITRLNFRYLNQFKLIASRDDSYKHYFLYQPSKLVSAEIGSKTYIF